MGWTSIYVKELEYDAKTKTYKRKEFLDKEYSCENDEYKWEVLKSSMVGTTWYGACRRTNLKTGESVIYGETILTSIDKMEFFWKEVSEDMGPYTIECPIGILNLLTPTDNPYAQQWRNKCRANSINKVHINSLWKRATNKTRTDYLLYRLPYKMQDGYERGDEVYLTYGEHLVKGKPKKCWTDGIYRFKRKDIDLFQCTFVAPDKSTFVPLRRSDLEEVIRADYKR